MKLNNSSSSSNSNYNTNKTISAEKIQRGLVASVYFCSTYAQEKVGVGALFEIGLALSFSFKTTDVNEWNSQYCPYLMEQSVLSLLNEAITTVLT